MMLTTRSRRYRRSEASQYLKEKWNIDRAPSTLAKYACVGGGPKFQHAARLPLYPEEELDAYAQSILSPLKSSTSDPGEEASRRSLSETIDRKGR
jgi:hypothetical protein